MEVTESPRIEELRRRVQKDPTSIAFAQLAEEYRRVGSYEEAVDACRAGLARHPTYLSARVTLARALMELTRYAEAQTELDAVLDLAPDNLAAIRALAEIHQRSGEGGQSPQKFTVALDLQLDETPPASPVDIEESVFEVDLEGGAPEDPLLPPAAAPPLAVAPPLVVAPPPPAAPPLVATPPPAAAPRVLVGLDALDALTLDLPPAPDFSSWTLDTAWTTPVVADIVPDVMPEVAPQVRSVPAEPPASDPAIDELQQWLAAIVRDRAILR